MTWHVTGTFTDNGSDNIETLREQAISQNPECGDQYDTAGKAVTLIIESGAIGCGKGFYVTMSGHANPNHEPSPGTASDVISVSVSRI